MHKDVIANRICYERVKVREQAQHFQRLLEIRPALDNKPPMPVKKKENPNIKDQKFVSKKERMQLDKNVQIQQENRLLLKKMLQIDLKPSELSKKIQKPTIFMIRSHSTGKARVSLNVHTRLEELRKIGEENKIILRKIQDSKPHYDHSLWEKEEKRRKHLVEKMSEFAHRYTKHPFFVNEGKPSNPAEKLYKTLLNSSESPSKKGHQLFAQTMAYEKKFLKHSISPLHFSKDSFRNLENEKSNKKKKLKKIKLKRNKGKLIFASETPNNLELIRQPSSTTNKNLVTLDEHFKTMEQKMTEENGKIQYQPAHGRAGVQRKQIRTAHESSSPNVAQLRQHSFEDPATTMQISVERNIGEGPTELSNVQSNLVSFLDGKSLNSQNRSVPISPLRTHS